jgi:hypothetical protein
MPVEDDVLRIGIDTFNMATVFKRRDDLNEVLAQATVASLIGEESKQLIPALVHPYANRLSVTASVIEQSLYGLLGHRSGGYPSLRDCRRVNWVLAGNVDQLRMGQPLSPFVKVIRKEWTPMVVVDAHTDISNQGHKGYTLVLMAIAGYATGEEFKRLVLSRGLFKHVHQKMFGLPPKKYEGLKLPEAYVGMWTWVLLDPGLKWDVFAHAAYTESFGQHNRDLLNSRMTKCTWPHLYEYNLKCVSCPVGSEICPRATHRGMRVQRECSACNKPGLFYEEDKVSTICIDCKHQDFMTRKRWAIKRRSHDNADKAEGGEPLVSAGT